MNSAMNKSRPVTQAHDLRSMVVNRLHLWECRKCGKRWTPSAEKYARRGVCEQSL